MPMFLLLPLKMPASVPESTVFWQPPLIQLWLEGCTCARLSVTHCFEHASIHAHPVLECNKCLYSFCMADWGSSDVDMMLDVR
jgi:hypothetical protein